MSEKLTAIEDAVVSLLSFLDKDAIKRSVIEEKVRLIAPIQGVNSEEAILEIIKKLEERFDITMSLGTLFSADDYRPWLDDTRGDIDWYYWQRYKRLLGQDRFPPLVIRSLDSITDQILDHMENPNKEGSWARKGMVVGHVQSGKTANYAGVVNKAADAGYKVIIILAGILNSLRNQTQSRIDSGFIGMCSTLKQEIGVGLICNEKKPAYFTTSTEDFKKKLANQIGVGIGDLKEPVVFVIKKNKSTLENLIEWLKNNNPHKLKDHPMLLVDDEADHASINTSKGGDEATTINRKIRELLRLFDRSTYLGYTATPFANVFIDPATDDEMLGDDLFPRDFIISLDPPDNYVGPDKIFSNERSLDIVRNVYDHESDLPIKHKKDWQPNDLPPSLKEAIGCFVLIKSIRILRGQSNKHNSMMINVSRFTDVQSNIKLLVDEYLKELRQAIINHYRLGETEALKNDTINGIKAIWKKEFPNSGTNWPDIQSSLKEAVSPIGVIEVNSSATAEPLDYSYHNYPNGRNVIAVGGLSLSRGLTLEGLAVSYFLRNSVMYDTLMQMGRWFGYRDRYEDLCRIYMTKDAESWYSHISDATEELREEFKRMKAARMSPRDFGLCVRSHPQSLIVTARNKMRTGERVLRKVSLEGRLVETSVLIRKRPVVEANLRLLENFIRNVSIYESDIEIGKPHGYYWKEVPVKDIKDFLNNFNNHPASQLTSPTPLIEYANFLANKGISTWNVVLISSKRKKADNIDIAGLSVNLQFRSVSTPYDNAISINKEKKRVGYAVQEAAGIEPDIVKELEDQYFKDNPKKKSIPGSVYRKSRNKPLLILHILDCAKENENSLFTRGIVAYGISFPGESGSRRPQITVEYVVNTVWWKNEYSDLLEDNGELLYE